eukprot:TRINITY_DN62380_c0_g1_i1.p1 TRINITY_DN62380_c0_g1~~TRINITY_DN62380_c0_g1_i1.p1  ORF type:complete len:539 (-),score=52.91 TRINITY_DN62380_c0_g1_i1:158-1774(-)
MKPGDWHCPRCRGLVFASRDSCRKCNVRRPPTPAAAPAASSANRPGDWNCPNCNDLVFASKSACRKCGSSKPAGGLENPAAAAAPEEKGRSGDWICPGCKGLTFASKSVCGKCGTRNPVASGLPGPSPERASDVVAPCDWTCPKCGDHVFARNSACRRCGSQRITPTVVATAPAGPVGDWTCPNCADHVFARNSKCRKCDTLRPEPLAGDIAASPAARPQDPTRAGDWPCPNCLDLQFARNDKCRQCGTARPQWLGADLSLKPPSYWTTVESGPWSLVPLEATEMAAFNTGFRKGATLGGRDQRTALDYTDFAPYCAWRLQHPGLWGKYAMERENIRKLEVASLRSEGIDLPDARLRQPFQDMARMLQGEVDGSINEVYLSHGSKPESLLAILSGGLNERFSGGLFGNGTYLAEDVGKNDQYCTYDEHHGAHPELHKLLFDDLGLHHPGKLLYVFVCRVVLGHIIRTKDGVTDLDDASRRSIWSSKGRELTTVPKTSPPLLHHSLLVEVGGKIARYREFILFHGDRIYPEYLVAYLRS